jgi:hypothetical protein
MPADEKKHAINHSTALTGFLVNITIDAETTHRNAKK